MFFIYQTRSEACLEQKRTGYLKRVKRIKSAKSDRNLGPEIRCGEFGLAGMDKRSKKHKKAAKQKVCVEMNGERPFCE